MGAGDGSHAGPASRRDPSTGRSDRELVVAFQQGDRDAYEQIYRLHGDRVKRICRRILHSRDEAEEAAQETFLRGYTALARFNGNYQLGAWLSRIAANVCFDHLRARSRTVPTSELAEGLPVTGGVKGLEASVEEQLSIGNALRDMLPLHGEALFMRGIQGLSHNEIAARLDITPEQAKALLHRARRSFKKAWWNLSVFVLGALWALRGRLTTRFRGQALGPADAFTSGSGATLMAERVATSAVAVALAISSVAGAGSGAPSTPHGQLALRPPKVMAPRSRGQEPPQAVVSTPAPAAAPATSLAAQRSKPETHRLAAVRDAVRTVTTKVDARKRQARRGHGGSPGQAAHSEVTNVVRRVKKVVRELPRS
jgi:RNA polymerase sigma-70 factor (ECF subfamily)